MLETTPFKYPLPPLFPILNVFELSERVPVAFETACVVSKEPLIYNFIFEPSHVAAK